jgi:hypothetical protein
MPGPLFSFALNTGCLYNCYGILAAQEFDSVPSKNQITSTKKQMNYPAASCEVSKNNTSMPLMVSFRQSFSRNPGLMKRFQTMQHMIDPEASFEEFFD